MSSKKSILWVFIFLFSACTKIDREALVTRHNVVQTQADPLNPLTVGNGEFAYTADITGMQTFPTFYEQGISLGTFSQWAWHSFPNPEGYKQADVVRYYQVGTDSVPYLYQFPPTAKERQYKATEWLRENPHRLHLGLIGLELTNSKNEKVEISDIKNPRQQLNLWNGQLKSTFEIDGIPIEVTTFCHQSLDRVSFKIRSKLIEQGKLKVKISFPYAVHGKFNTGYDFNSPEKHTSKVLKQSDNTLIVERQIDSTTYYSRLNWYDAGTLNRASAHEFMLTPSAKSNTFEMSCHFSKEDKKIVLPSFSETEENNTKAWKAFWKSGAAVDFSKCTDPRAKELERRVILSQYLTKIQCSGSIPPQETGLTTNSWHGKFHMEMHWWHAAHFILWNRNNLIEKHLEYYSSIFNKAKQTAQFQGYDGVRWPKMTDPSGNESPSTIGVFLVWQQPHIIYLTELLYRSKNSDKKIIEKYSLLIEATADFMASYTRWDSLNSRYVLGPALIPAQECFDPETTINPAFELAYWKWGLQTAQNQRIALGLKPNEKWQHIIDYLSPLPVRDRLYLFSENATDSYSNPNYLTDHPIVLAIAGFLPLSNQVDRAILEKTFDAIIKKWDWETAWGWDFPLVAMCVTVLDRPQQAIDFLLMDTQKNSYLHNGHNYQNEQLPLYLPGNGGLLSAISMMCTYRNNDGKNGFSAMSGWNVTYENMNPSLISK